MPADVLRAVLDANVLASGAAGFLSPTSAPGELVRRWLAGEYELIISEPIRTEVANTLRNPYFLQRTPDDVRAALDGALGSQARTVAITVPVSGVASHPEDDRVLATAVSAPANYLVTGDKPLQALVAYQGVTIVSPRAFLNIPMAREGALGEVGSER